MAGNPPTIAATSTLAVVRTAEACGVRTADVLAIRDAQRERTGDLRDGPQHGLGPGHDLVAEVHDRRLLVPVRQAARRPGVRGDGQPTVRTILLHLEIPHRPPPLAPIPPAPPDMGLRKAPS